MKAELQRSALDFFPEDIDYPSLRTAASGCMGCELYKLGTQTVFGEGKLPVTVALIRIPDKMAEAEIVELAI